MTVFIYDSTFEGLLCTVFEAYALKLRPDRIVSSRDPLPLFCDKTVSIATDENKARRVWKGLGKKISRNGLALIRTVWLSELPERQMLLFRYICKNIDAPSSLELNFGDADVLAVSQIGKKVNREKHRMLQFVRFRKTADDVFFAVFEPLYDILPLTLSHFKDRFGDQKWLIYDVKRKYGYYYDKTALTEIEFGEDLPHLHSGKPDDTLLAEDEKQFQELWKTYFRSVTVRERLNPRLHRQNMPVRFWKYLIEKQE